MTWSLTASGIADTVEEAEALFSDFRQFLANHKYKTNFSSFTGQGVTETNFHGAGPVAEAPAEAPPAPQEPLAEEPAAADPAPVTETVPAGPGEADDPPAQ